MPSQKRRLSRISAMHYFKLFFRGSLFLAAAVVYLLDRPQYDNPLYDDISRWPVLFDIIWVVFVVEMILRFFPPIWRAWAARSSSHGTTSLSAAKTQSLFCSPPRPPQP